MYKRITTLFLIFISVSLFSQEATFKAGEFIILLQKNSSFETFVQQYSGNGRDVIIDEYKRLSASEPVYLIKVISTTGKEKQELSFIKNLSAVALAQLNHIVSKRDVGTDDPRYKDQWQWKNTGQDGGIQGADISAETAWETTTGGKTANGDTIVVCIVDDGTNYEHEDLAANIWFNSKEIPGNNIDDDGNGFIDDVHGWNFQNNDSNVNEGGHGVNVNGMIGAVGNNGIGVSGINWNVKMMNVVYAGTEESSVIESYDYPLQSRILYNNTNGSEGAFVVSVNSSWGIDYGKPADAPIWCNFYDVMGAAGILSVAATSNSNVNVDVDGDLPTGCTSPYLISVGRTNNKDAYAACGYGVVSIDLGAPGVNIVTTRSNNRYTTTTGTSFSSPLVAGMVALLYSYPCEGIGQLMKSDPTAFALTVKNAILQGVDVFPSYADKVLSSGRSNMAKALNVMSLACSACQPGSVQTFEYLTDDTYRLTFDDSQLQTNIRYRPLDSVDWIVLNNVDSPLDVLLPLTCTLYEFQLQSICEPNDTSLWGISTTFQSERCCQPFLGITIASNSEGTITVENVDLNQNENSIIHYIKDGDLNYSTLEATSDSMTINGLESCAFYEVFATVICVAGDTITSDTFRIFTQCPSTCETNVCTTDATALFGYIDRTVINGAVAESGLNRGYINFGDFLNISLPEYGAFPNTVDVKKLQGQNGRIRIFIDINKNGTFETSENLFTQVIGVNNTSINYNMDFNGALDPGTYKMRMMLTFLATAQPCNGDQGEVEDYCVNVYPVLVNECDQIDSVCQANKTFTTIDLSWEDPEDDVIAYAYRYRELPGGDYTYLSDTARSITLQGLKECKEYEFGVITVCQTDTSFFKTIHFKTDCSMASNTLDNDITWKVFPNPFGERINVILTSRKTTDSRLRLIDSKGNTVIDRALKLTTGDHYFDLDTNANLPPGMYILTLTDKDGIKTSKLIKQ